MHNPLIRMNIKRGEEFALNQQTMLKINSYRWCNNHEPSPWSVLWEKRKVVSWKVWMWSNNSIVKPWPIYCVTMTVYWVAWHNKWVIRNLKQSWYATSEMSKPHLRVRLWTHAAFLRSVGTLTVWNETPHRPVVAIRKVEGLARKRMQILWMDEGGWFGGKNGRETLTLRIKSVIIFLIWEM